MSDILQIDPNKTTALGSPIHALENDDVEIAEGALGNPVLLNDDDVFVDTKAEFGGTFYMMVAAAQGKKASEVAEILKNKHQVIIRPFQPSGTAGDTSSFRLKVMPEQSFHYLDRQVKGSLRFQPRLDHLRAIYGDKADYFMVAFALPNNRENIFGNDFRTVRDSIGDPTGETIETRKFDLIQKSAAGVVEVMRRGGLALFDRQDPAGVPVALHGAVMSDIHLCSRNDEFARDILLKLKDRDMYLRFNNANANLMEGIIPWINAEYDAGRLDWVMTMGDNVDYDGRSNETSRRLTDSNQYFVAKFLSRIKAPVFAGLGNHDLLPQAHPAVLTHGNYNLEAGETMDLEKERYRDVRKFFGDMVASTTNDPNSLIPHYDTINPFHDFAINFGKGKPADPNAREARLVFMDMGGADVAHWKQDDPIYRDVFQGWPWQLPFLHPKTIYDFVFKQSPDVHGPSADQVTWLSGELHKVSSHTYLFGHPPFLNTEAAAKADDPKKPVVISPLVRGGNREDFHFNTMTHDTQMFGLLMENSNFRAGFGGHAHVLTNKDFVAGSDTRNNVQVFTGPARAALNAATTSAGRDEKDTEAARFWFPEEHCAAKPDSPACKFHGESVGTIRNRKVFTQLGAAGVGDPPVFAVMTLNPDGLISEDKMLFLGKKLQVSGNRATVGYEVAAKVQTNKEVAAEFKKLQAANPQLTLDVSEDAKAAEDRLSTADVSFIPRPESLKEYPRYNEVIDHPYISPTKIDPQLRFKFSNNALTAIDHPGISVEYAYSQNQIGRLSRSFFLEGFEGGYLYRDEAKRHEAYLAYRSPALVDWKMFPHFILRGLSFMGGPEVSWGQGGFDARFHNDLNIMEANLHLGGVEFFVGLDKRNVFSGPGETRFIGGVNIKMKDVF